MKKSNHELYQELDNLFIELYEETKENVNKLVEDKKEYETVPEDADEDDLDCYYVPGFVMQFLKKQVKLMNKIADKYAEI